MLTDNAPPSGPFACTELMGLLTTGEWFKAGFLDALGADLSPKWGGRFAHYGYVYEYANPESYVWTPTPVGGVNNVQIREVRGWQRCPGSHRLPGVELAVDDRKGLDSTTSQRP